MNHRSKSDIEMIRQHHSTLNLYALLVVSAFVASSNPFISLSIPSSIAVIAFASIAILLRLNSYDKLGLRPSHCLLYASVPFFLLLSGLIGGISAQESFTWKGLFVSVVYPIVAFLALLPARNADIAQITIYLWRYAQFNILGSFICVLWQLSGRTYLTSIQAYRTLFFFPFSLSDAAIGAGDLYRPAGFFDEPGTVGMFYLFVFALISSQGLWKSLHNARFFLILSASCFSAAYLVSLIMGYIFCRIVLLCSQRFGKLAIRIKPLVQFSLLWLSFFAMAQVADLFVSSVYQRIATLFSYESSNRFFFDNYSFSLFGATSCFTDPALCNSLYNSYQPLYYVHLYGLLGSLSVITVFATLLRNASVANNLYCASIVLFFLQRTNLFSSYPCILLATLFVSILLRSREKCCHSIRANF